MSDSTINMSKQRDATFDIMKGIGILLVITAHYFGWNHPLLGRSINSFHMPMFFIVAGYFSKPFSSWCDAGTQIKKYSRRLIPAFVFTQIIIVCWTILMVFTKEGDWDAVINQTLSLFWADPFGPNTPWGRLSIGVIWFLIALFVAKGLLLLLSRLKEWSIPVSLVLAFGAILLHKVFPYSIWCISLGLTALPFVTIGWWFRTHHIPTWFKAVCVICWFAAIAFSSLVMYDIIWKCFPLDILGACGGTYCLYLLSKTLSKYLTCIGRVFAILGIWSLAIMCFHDLEMYCHLGNHIMAVSPVSLPVWSRFAFRYLLTIALAAAAVYAPVTKKMFT